LPRPVKFTATFVTSKEHVSSEPFIDASRSYKRYRQRKQFTHDSIPMVRIDSISAILVLGNLIAFMAFGLIGFDGDISAIQKERQELERQLPLLKEKFNWANEAKACAYKTG
jgi:hypothetical protein